MFALVLLLAIACVTPVQDEPKPWRQVSPEDHVFPAREGTEHRPKAMTPYMSLPIPPGITKSDLALFATLMELDADQTVALEKLHEDYAAKNSALRKDVEQALYDRSTELASNVREPSVERELQRGALLADADALTARIEDIDAWFMGEAGVVLEGVSEARIDRMRQLRRRDVCSGHHIDVRSAAIDLCRLQLEMQINLMADAVDPDALRAAQVDYEQLRTNMLQQQRRASIQSRELEVEFIRALEQARTLDAEEDQEELALLHEQSQQSRLRSRKPRIDIWKRLTNLNDRHIETLRALAPGEACEQLVNAYREQAYPMAFPDPARLDPVFVAIVQTDGVPEGAQNAIADIRAEYDNQHEAQSQAIMAFYNDWFEPFRLTLTLNMFEFNAKGEQFETLWSRRIELSEDTWLRVRDVLDANTVAAIDDAVANWKRDVDKTRQAGPQGVSPYRTAAQRKAHEQRPRIAQPAN